VKLVKIIEKKKKRSKEKGEKKKEYDNSIARFRE
jgi:hypothetical protein